MVVQRIGTLKTLLFTFFLKTANSNVSRQLLKYRYNHLVKAKENAKKLGFKDGANFVSNGNNEW